MCKIAEIIMVYWIEQIAISTKHERVKKNYFKFDFYFTLQMANDRGERECREKKD